MEVQMAEEKVVRLIPQLSFDDAKILVEEKKVNQVVGTLGSIFSRPKPEDIILSYSEVRYEPFWVVKAHLHLEYERQQFYTVTASGPEVSNITIFGQTISTTPQSKGGPTIQIQGIEGCVEDIRLRKVFTGEGTKHQSLEKYLTFPNEEITDLANYVWDGVCEIPVTKSAAVIRQVMTELVRPIKAQIIHQEIVTLEEINLCFRPIYAFEYIWQAKNKNVIVECDGMTLELSNGGKTLKKQFKSLLDPDLLFDLTADATGTIIPGGSIVVKLTRAVMKSKKG